MKRWILAILTAIMLCGACAQADYQTGWEAESAGDIELAFELWEKAAAQGDADSAYALGYRYQIGTYGEVDYAKAMEYFKIAAEQNLPRGQYAVGLMYRKGQGVQQDNAAALEWYLKAAALGHGTAMNNIGLIYKEQDDYAAAMEWYLKAYTSGYDGMDGAPCTNIGSCIITVRALNRIMRRRWNGICLARRQAAPFRRAISASCTIMPKALRRIMRWPRSGLRSLWSLIRITSKRLSGWVISIGRRNTG